MLARAGGHGATAHPRRRLATFELKCLLCGRVAGQVVARVFIAGGQARARIWTKTPRCGACGGTLLLEREASVGAPRQLLTYWRLLEAGAGERRQP